MSETVTVMLTLTREEAWLVRKWALEANLAGQEGVPVPLAWMTASAAVVKGVDAVLAAADAKETPP